MISTEFGSDAREVYPGELIGYRYWNVDRSRRLRSMMIATVIWSREVKAACAREWITILGNTTDNVPHDSPGVRCKCGIYGWYTPQAATGGSLLADLYNRLGVSIFGAVAVSGAIIPGTIGFRAERARILGVVDPKRRIDMTLYPDVARLDTPGDLIELFPPQEVPWAR